MKTETVQGTIERYNKYINEKELVRGEKASKLPHCQRMQSDKARKQVLQRHVQLGVMEA